MRWLARIVSACAALLLAAPSAFGAISVSDDSGRSITLPQPAQRIVSLAPHATEILFAAGAGQHIVGVTEYSDFPPAARDISSVGSGVALDLERIVRLKPDLVVAWESGNSAPQVARLEALGIPVYRSEPHDFAAIAATMEKLGRLTGTPAAGESNAANFRARLAQLQARYRHRPRVTVFYQIWRSPLMTLNGEHMVSAALDLCGGENIFASLPQLAPTVGIESVLQADPDAIIASSGAREDGLAQWRRFPKLKAVAMGNLLVVDGNLLNRPGPRVLDGVEALCRLLDTVREKRQSKR